jgi:hypothetical protein
VPPPSFTASDPRADPEPKLPPPDPNPAVGPSPVPVREPVEPGPDEGLNERNLRSIVSKIDWNEQRHMFQEITDRSDNTGDSEMWQGRISSLSTAGPIVLQAGAPDSK